MNIAVMDLEGLGLSSVESRIITSRLRTDLVNTQKFVVIERAKMNDILQEQGFQLSGCTSDECVIEAGKILGVQAIVAGELGKLGDMYTLSIRLVDVETGTVLSTATDDCNCKIGDVLTRSVKNVTSILAGTPISTKNYSQNNSVRDEKYKITSQELRYAKSLFQRHKPAEAKKILEKFLNSPNAKIQEEAMALRIIWNFASDPKESAEKFNAFFPNSTWAAKIDSSVRLRNSKISFFEPQMVFIEGGQFDMGDVFSSGRKNELPVHKVDLSDYYMSAHEITNHQFAQFCDETNRKHPNLYTEDQKQFPIVNVSLEDAQDYCRWLKSRTGKNYMLPTEAQWEYAARSRGLDDIYSGVSDENELAQFAWYFNNSSNSLHPVGTRKPNRIGLYDMTGNVRELCIDNVSDYKLNLQKNPRIRNRWNVYIVRGGCYLDKADKLRTTYRFFTPYLIGAPGGMKATDRNGKTGFRVVINLK